MARKMYAGNAPATTLNGAINSTTSTIVVTSGTGYPSGASGNFYIVIDRGLSAEEKILCSATSGATITAVDRTVSGNRDGTTNASHVSGATVEHVFTAQDADEANSHVNDNTTNVHTQYLLKDGTVAPTGVTNIAAAPGASAVGDVAAKGAGPTLATSNHVHGREAFAAPSGSSTANTTGSATTVNHSDHVHLTYNHNAGRATKSGAQSMGTSATDITSLTVTFTAVASRMYLISLWVPVQLGTLTAPGTISLQEGATNLASWNGFNPDASSAFDATAFALYTGTFSAGSHTVKATGLHGGGTGNSLLVNPVSTNLAVLLVEDIGT